MVMKFKVTAKFMNTDLLSECLNSIKNLISNIQEKPVKEIQGQMLSTLKQYILSFE